MERSYRLSRTDIANTVRALLDNATIKLESTAPARAALANYETAGIGFPNCLIVTKGRHPGCSHALTFDQRIAALPGVELL